jgi:hypothetical protein
MSRLCRVPIASVCGNCRVCRAAPRSATRDDQASAARHERSARQTRQIGRTARRKICHDGACRLSATASAIWVRLLRWWPKTARVRAQTRFERFARIAAIGVARHIK